MAVKRGRKSKPARRAALQQVPSPPGKRVPSPCVVGIGASAGGFDALVEFLRVTPANSGLAFIILQHLSPSPRSLSAELFSRHTAMSVRVAQEGERLDRKSTRLTPVTVPSRMPSSA